MVNALPADTLHSFQVGISGSADRSFALLGISINYGYRIFDNSTRKPAKSRPIIPVNLRGGSAGLRNPKAIVAFVHDAAIAAASLGVALYLRLGDEVFALDPFTTAVTSFVFAAIACVTFQLFGMYRGVWRYASTVDLLNIAKATTVALLIFGPLCLAIDFFDFVPRSVPFIQWCLLIVALGGTRFAYRVLRDQGLLSPGT